MHQRAATPSLALLFRVSGVFSDVLRYLGHSSRLEHSFRRTWSDRSLSLPALGLLQRSPVPCRSPLLLGSQHPVFSTILGVRHPSSPCKAQALLPVDQTSTSFIPVAGVKSFTNQGLNGTQYDMPQSWHTVCLKRKTVTVEAYEAVAKAYQAYVQDKAAERIAAKKPHLTQGRPKETFHIRQERIKRAASSQSAADPKSGPPAPEKAANPETIHRGIVARQQASHQTLEKNTGSFLEEGDPENREKVLAVCSRFGITTPEAVGDISKGNPCLSLQNRADVETCLSSLFSEGVPRDDLPTVITTCQLLNQTEEFPAKLDFLRSLGLAAQLRELLQEHPTLWHRPLEDQQETVSVLKRELGSSAALQMTKTCPRLLTVGFADMQLKIRSLQRVLDSKILSAVALANPSFLTLPSSLIACFSEIFLGRDGLLGNFLLTLEVPSIKDTLEEKLKLLASGIGQHLTTKMLLHDPGLVYHADTVVGVFDGCLGFLGYKTVVNLLWENPTLFQCSWTERVKPTLDFLQAHANIHPREALETTIWVQEFSLDQLQARLRFLKREGITVVSCRKRVKRAKSQGQVGLTITAVVQPLNGFKKQYPNYRGP